MSSAVQAAERRPLVAVPDAAQERHLRRLAAPAGGAVSRGRRRGRPTAARTAAIASPSPSRRVPLPWAISGRPPPRPSIALTACLDERAGGDATRDEVVADRDEQLRLVGIEAERDDAARQRAADVLGEALERVDRLEVERSRPRTRRPGATSSARRGDVARASGGRRRAPAFGGGASSRAARPGARRSAPRPPPADVRPTASAARSSGANRSSIRRSAAAPVTASMRRIPDPMLRSPVMTKLPIWPRRAAVRAAAQLVAEALDPDRPHPLAVLLVEERVRAGVLAPRPSSSTRSPTGAVLAHDAADLAPRWRASRRRSGRGRTGSRSAGSRACTSEPAWRARSPTTLRSARWSRCVPVWLRIVCARRSASTSAADDVADPRPRRGAMPRWTVRPAACVPATRWTSSTVEQRRSVGRPQDAGVRDLAAALRVERGAVQHDLGPGGGLGPQLHLGHGLERLVLDAVPQDRDDTALGRRASRSPGTPVGRRAGEDLVVARRELGRPRRGRPSCPPGSARAARRARPRTRRGPCGRRTRPRARR